MSTIDNINWEALSEDELNLVIERAQAALEQARKDRLDQVQEQVRALATSVGLSPEELVMQMHRGSRRSGKASLGNTDSNVRFRNPENQSQVWTGKGKRPKWLVEKIEAGANLEDFRV